MILYDYVSCSSRQLDLSFFFLTMCPSGATGPSVNIDVSLDDGLPPDVRA